MKGTFDCAANCLPKLDLPAPRKPMSAMRWRREFSLAGESNSSPNKVRALANSTSVRSRRISRIINQSGEEAVSSPVISASEQFSTELNCRKNCIDAFPTPDSTLATWRSETSAICAKALRVRPRRARKSLRRSPREIKKGSLSRSSESLVIIGSSG